MNLAKKYILLHHHLCRPRFLVAFLKYCGMIRKEGYVPPPEMADTVKSSTSLVEDVWWTEA